MNVGFLITEHLRLASAIRAETGAHVSRSDEHPTDGSPKAAEEQRRANIDLGDGTETAFQEERTRLMRTSLGHGGL